MGGVAISALAVSAFAAVDPAFAEAASEPVASSAVDASVSEVVVTGLRGLRKTAIDSPAPIDVIGKSQLTDTGKVGLKEILNTAVPSFDLPGVNGGGTSWTVRAFTIRGLNGDQALFLVNGKRRHNTALINNLASVGNGGSPVDVDLIPVAAIDHIEVLRDGAAAQYGSDAIAGVINIILKTGDSGGGSNSTLGEFFKGDGLTAHEAADFGLKLPNEGFLHLSVDAKFNEAASRSQLTTSTIYGPVGKPYGYDPRDFTANRSFYGDSYGPGEESIVSGAYNAELPWGGVTYYSFGTVSDRNSRKNTGSFLPNNSDSLASVYPNGFNALRRIYETDFQWAGGARFQAYGWDADLSTTYGRDYAYLAGENTINASLGPTSPTYFHLSTQIFDQLTTNLDLTRSFEVGLAKPLTVSAGLEHRYESFEIQAGDPASYTVGDYVIPTGLYAGQRPAPGLASYSGTAPSDAGSIDRNNVAAYIDLSTEPVKNWYVGAAGRFEHYTGGPGDTASGKLSTRWEFLPHYAVRATVSNGFRAPSLAQDIFASSTITGQVCPSSGSIRGASCNPGDYVTYPTKFLPVDSAAAQALGAKTLKPETSMNYSIGLTAEPIHRLLLTLDAYQIDIDNRIVSTSYLNLTAANLGSSPDLAALLPRFPNGFIAQYFTNAVSTRTQGIDFVGERPFNLGRLGRVNLSAAYTYTKTDITKIDATPAQLAAFGFTLFDRQKQSYLTVATPKDKIILAADWSIGPWRASLHETRYGQYTEVNSAADRTQDRTFDPNWITDLDISFALSPKTSVAIGAENLFDVYPQKIGLVNSQTGGGLYGNFSPFGITGGFCYARFSQKF